jgi:hypothetical protein
MKPMYIELFVDRLCGLFPKDNIARNTVKKAWLHDEYLILNVEEEEVKAALSILEADKAFPSLHRVKEVFRSNRKSKIAATVGPICPICGGTGWDNGERWEKVGDTGEISDYVVTTPRWTQIGIFGDTQGYVQQCEECPV